MRLAGNSTPRSADPLMLATVLLCSAHRQPRHSMCSLRASLACALLALLAPAATHAAIASPYEHPTTGLPPHSPHTQARHHHMRTEDIPQCTPAQIAASGVAASYDWIIVGAGAAGSILAANLSAAFAPASMLLLESGPRTGNTDNDAIRDPALWLDVLHNSTLEWGFISAPQVALNSRSIPLGFAKATGGSAAHNAMGYVRGGRGWMDAWASAEGCAGWDAATLSPYFDEVERRLQVVFPINDTAGLVDAIFQAANEQGFPYNADYNHGTDMLGIANFVMSIQDLGETEEQQQRVTAKDVGQLQAAAIDVEYQRVTSYQIYLEEAPFLSKSFQLASGFLALRIVFDSSAPAGVPTVQGLEILDQAQNCMRQINLGSGELILSAGTINTPALLQVSGIGNATQLQAAGVEVLLDLPGVGANLRDDVVVNLVFTSPTITIESPPASFLSAVMFAVDPQGPGAAAAAAARASIGESASEEDATVSMTDIELLFSTGNMLRNSWPVSWQNSLVLSPNVQQLLSRGRVTIASADPLDKPTIDPAYLTAEGDMTRVLNALNLSRTLLSSPAFAPFAFEEVLPGSNVTSPSDLVSWVQSHAATGFHYIGTAKMGSWPADNMAVVDPETMRVWGASRLRVVDASVAPTSFSANTQSLTMAVAGRAVDLIIAERKKMQAQQQEELARQGETTRVAAE